MDIPSMVRGMLSPIVNFFKVLILSALSVALVLLLLFIAVFFVRYRLNPFRLSADRLRCIPIRFRPYDLFRWLLVDFLTLDERKNEFDRFGFSIFCGKQGSGKTISMVQYLYKLRQKYPNIIIVTNFSCTLADRQMSDWRDFLEIRNGLDGVVFAIDEIQNEYNAESWKDFPETLLREICMQRKQRVKIVTTAQVFGRVVKQIREQTFSVIMCSTFFNRLTFNREYDADEYATGDTPYMLKKRCKPIEKSFFVQSDSLRQCYDTYEKIKTMSKTVFLPRSERGK